MSKKILSLLLAVVMIVLAIPAVVLPTFAATGVESGGAASSTFTAADDIVAYKDSYTTTGQIFEYAKENWEIGGLSVTDPKTGYYTANYYNATYGAVAGNSAGAGNFAQISKSAGFYLTGWQGPGMLCFAAGYSGSGDNRTCTGLVDNVTARYTAPYTGTVTIDVTKLIFANTWSALFCILVNGEPVGQFDTEGFDYASGAGWLDPTAADSTALVEDITVAVNKGDVIDFVVRGTGADINNIDTIEPGTTFKYSGAKYGLKDWGFGVTYNTSIKSTFNVEENFILDGVDTWATTVPTAADITNNGAWQAGLYGVTLDQTEIVKEGATLWDYLTIDNSFMAFNKIGSANTGEIHVERQDYAGSFQARALYLQKSSEHRAGWGIFLNTGADYGYATDGTQPSRPLERYPNATAVRYTAQYSGKVSVTLDGGWYNAWAGEYQHLFVRHNGVVIKDIVNTGTDVLETISLTVNKGDTIEFVSVIDPILSKEYSTNNPAAAAKWQSLTDILAVRRGFRIDNIDVTYDSATAVVDSTFAGTNGGTSNPNRLGEKSDMIRFFQWFDANGEMASGSTLAEGCYAAINPALIEAGVVSADDTLVAAYENFCNYIKKNDCITVANSDWAIGHYTDAGVLNEVKYPAYYHGMNLLLAGSTITTGDGQFYVSETLFDSLMANVMTALLGKNIVTGTVNGVENTTITADNDDQVAVGTLNVPFSSTVSSMGYPMSVANGAAALGHPTNHSLFPGYASNSHAGFQYTAPKDGKLTFTFNSMYASKEFKYKVAKNGTYLQEWTNTDVNATGVESYIESLSFDVKKGDKITFVFSRGAGGSGVYVAPNITANLSTAVGLDTTASLTITEDYALNAYGNVAGATAISAVVGDTTVAGVVQDNGSFKMVLKEGIKLTDLPAAEVDYYLVAEVNGHKITGAPATLNGEALLTAYANGTDEKVANLAKDVHYLAIAANYANSKVDGAYTGTPLTTEQESWVNRNLTALEGLSTDVTYTGEGAYRIVGVNANLGDRLSLVLLISADETADIWDLQNGEYTLNVSNATRSFTANEFKWVSYAGEDYMGVIVDVPVVAYGETFDFVVRQGETDASAVLTYGLNTWCVRTATNANLDATMKNVARAVYNLGASAAAYKESL